MAREDGAPTPERIVQAFQSFQEAEALAAAVELDLFSAFHGRGQSLAELSLSLAVPARGLRGLLEFLVSAGFIEKSGPVYRPSADAALYLDRSSPRFLGDSARFYLSETMRRAFHGTLSAVRRGGAPAGAVDSMAPDHPVWTEYAKVMAPLFRGAAESMAERLLQEDPSPRRLLDVAAGHGVFGIAVAQRVPELEVTAVDWPSVVGYAAERARQEGLGKRYRTIPGSAFDAPLDGPYDLAVVANFLHHFPPERIRQLLRRVGAALRPGGRIAVVEFVPNEDRSGPAPTARLDLAMLVTTAEGATYTFPELGALLRESGFEDPRLLSLAHSPERLVLARRSS